MTEEKAVELRDFDAVAPARRVIRIAGEEADVTVFPARVTMELERFFRERQSGKVAGSDQVERIVSLISRVTTAGNPQLTADWLLDHLDLLKIYDLIAFILEPMTKRAEEFAAKQGNAAAAGQSE